jgi:hypothetical protein
MTKKMNSFKKNFLNLAMISSVVLLASSCDKNDDYVAPQQPQVVANVLKSAGDSLGIVATVNQFRTILGDLNTTPNQTSGRREVNWDGVPVTFTNNNTFPLDFFNSLDPNASNARKKGLLYLNTGSPLRVDSSNFIEIDADYVNEFIPFSKKKTIIAANSNISEVAFKVAATTTDAFIKGFGIIFSDVDDANSSSLEFFNGNKSLGVFKAPAKTATGPYSFLGVYFPNEKVTKVKITAGNAVLAAGVKDVSDNGNKDLVSYDDFLYDEPKQLQ